MDERAGLVRLGQSDLIWSNLVSLQVHMFEVISRINKARRIVAQERGRPATDAEIAALVGMSVEKLKMILRSTRGTQSMERPIGKEGDTTVGVSWFFTF